MLLKGPMVRMHENRVQFVAAKKRHAHGPGKQHANRAALAVRPLSAGEKNQALLWMLTFLRS